MLREAIYYVGCSVRDLLTTHNTRNTKQGRFLPGGLRHDKCDASPKRFNGLDCTQNLTLSEWRLLAWPEKRSERLRKEYVHALFLFGCQSKELREAIYYVVRY